MAQLIEKISAALHVLPKKDIEIAERLLKKRDFQSLLEIVDSDIYLVRKHQDDEVPKEEYANLKIEDIIDLRSDLSEYMSYILPPEDWEDNHLGDLGGQFYDDL
jgi:hypothetical protein